MVMQDYFHEVRFRERARVRLDSTLAGSAALFGAVTLGTLDGNYTGGSFFLPALAFVVIAAVQHLRQRDRGFARVRRFYIAAAALLLLLFVPFGPLVFLYASPFGVLAVSVAICAAVERSRYAAIAGAALVLVALIVRPGLFSKIRELPYEVYAVADSVVGVLGVSAAAAAAVLAWRQETRALER
jgi:hypothetical protein